MQHLNVDSARQYQREEQVLMLQRAAIIEDRLAMLLDAMSDDALAPEENVSTCCVSRSRRTTNAALNSCAAGRWGRWCAKAWPPCGCA